LMTDVRRKILEGVLEAIRVAETSLPIWVYEKLLKSYEQSQGIARSQLAAILKNVEIATKESKPMCQDTGLVTFYVEIGKNYPMDEDELKEILTEALRIATKEIPIRPNTMDPINGKNPGDNTGKGMPIINIKRTKSSTLRVYVRPKGGGSEYPTQLCMIPPSKGLRGVYECLLKAVFNAGGKPCPPGIVSVAFGSTVEEAFKLSKKKLYRKEHHEEERVKALEEGWLQDINSLEIGPMGLGGYPSVLDVKIDYLYRHPASFPVAVTFNCWAAREAAVEFDRMGNYKIISENVTPTSVKSVDLGGQDGIEIKLPVKDDEVRSLKVGDIVYLTGTIVTARDEAHKKIIEEGAPIDMKGLAIYHCGPVVRRKDGVWEVVAAGPTTSARMNDLETKALEKTGAKLIIGKGGMKDELLEDFKRLGVVYLAFTGGAALLAAKRIKRVKDVYWLDELGIPEALWVFEVERFGPLVVAMDSHGNSLYKEVLTRAKRKLEELLK